MSDSKMVSLSPGGRSDIWKQFGLKVDNNAMVSNKKHNVIPNYKYVIVSLCGSYFYFTIPG